jgi:hypothetical protein
MKAATWLHSAIIPLSDLSEGADEDSSELDTNVDKPGSIDKLYHYITEKEKWTGPQFICSYATGSEEYGGDKSLKDPWEKASIIAPYVTSDLIARCLLLAKSDWYVNKGFDPYMGPWLRICCMNHIHNRKNFLVKELWYEGYGTRSKGCNGNRS